MPFAILTLLAAATPAAAPLRPAGPWIVREEEEMCLLERDYPLGTQKIALLFQPLLDLPSMDIFEFEDDTNAGHQFVGTFDVAVDPGKRDYAGRYLSVIGKAKKSRVTRLSAARTLFDELKDGDTVRIQAKPIDRMFVIVRPEQARVALAKCVAELKLAWGIDPRDADRVATPIDGNPARYFSADSYPAEAVHQGIYGRVVALLSISTGGAVSKCRILSSAGAALNDGTCKAAMRIRFKPPLDIDGKPLPSTYILPVRWVLPGVSE